MPECARCGAFTDNPAEKDHHYCDTCLDRFAEIEQHGIVIEQDTDGTVHVIVTARDVSVDSGTEHSQVDGLARGKHIAEETGLDAIFTYQPTGSTWLLDAYLQAHPSIRKEVHDRLCRVPERSSDGIIERIKELL